MSKLPKHYEKIEKLGSGSYGCVYKARDSRSGAEVALKETRNLDTEDGIAKSIVRELSILRHLGSHPNIMPLLDVVEHAKRLWPVMELADGDLNDVISCGPSHPTLVQSYVYQALCGLAYCHSKRVIHRDITPGNILVDTEGHLKLCDFGIACFVAKLDSSREIEVCTRWYRAPELLLGSSRYNYAIDLWSLGCVMLEMIKLEPLFPGDSEIDTLYRIFRLLGTPTEASWPGCTKLPFWRTNFPRWSGELPLSKRYPALSEKGEELALSLLCCDPAQRNSAKKALKHPYLHAMRLHWETHGIEGGLRDFVNKP